MNGYGIFFVPLSWAYGRWDASSNKTLWALGPFRVFKCRNLKPWKSNG